MTITLLLLWALSGVATFVLLIFAAVFMFRRKSSKTLWISSGITAALFVVFLIATGLSSTMDQNESSEVAGNSESDGKPIQTEIGKQAEKDRENELDLSEYKEADLKKMHGNEYGKQTKLKISNAQVITVMESDEEIGSKIVVHVDNIPAVIYDMHEKTFEKGAVYTFYGTPNEGGEMILIDFEKIEDSKPLPHEEEEILDEVTE